MAVSVDLIKKARERDKLARDYNNISTAQKVAPVVPTVSEKSQGPSQTGAIPSFAENAIKVLKQTSYKPLLNDTEATKRVQEQKQNSGELDQLIKASKALQMAKEGVPESIDLNKPKRTCQRFSLKGININLL